MAAACIRHDLLVLGVGLAAGIGLHALFLKWHHDSSQQQKKTTMDAKPPGSEHDVLVSCEELENFCCGCLEASGCTKKNASTAARVILAADLRGISSHGIQRLYLYCDEIKSGAVDGTGSPRLLEQRHTRKGESDAAIDNPACRTVDGNNCQGTVVSCFAVDVAVDLARKHGCALVVARNSNHFGIGGYYTDHVARNHGMICLCMTNTSAVTAPTHAREACLGTNVLSFAAPTKQKYSGNGTGYPILVDMATTTVPFGRLEIFELERIPLPSSNWAVDCEGRPCRNASEVIHNGGLVLPLGGATEIDGGHKGYCAALMVELMCGILGGSDCFGKNVEMTMNPRAVGKTSGGTVSHCFLVVDPGFFHTSNDGTSYEERAGQLSEQLRNLDRVDPNQPVRVPGDRTNDEVLKRQRDGIPITRPLAERLRSLSIECNVPLPAVLKQENAAI